MYRPAITFSVTYSFSIGVLAIAGCKYLLLINCSSTDRSDPFSMTCFVGYNQQQGCMMFGKSTGVTDHVTQQRILCFLCYCSLWT